MHKNFKKFQNSNIAKLKISNSQNSENLKFETPSQKSQKIPKYVIELKYPMTCEPERTYTHETIGSRRSRNEKQVSIERGWESRRKTKRGKGNYHNSVPK